MRQVAGLREGLLSRESHPNVEAADSPASGPPREIRVRGDRHARVCESLIETFSRLDIGAYNTLGVPIVAHWEP